MQQGCWGVRPVLSGASVLASLNPPRLGAMTWSELQRLVEQAERDSALRRALMRCRSRCELVLASQRLGFGIDGRDLKIAWELHRVRCPGSGDRRRVTSRHRDRWDRRG